MKSVATRLPFEVFDIINTYLYDKERSICMTVCLRWYLIFKQFLYKDIMIRDYKQFRLLYRVINQGFDTVDDTGSHVRSISFEPSAITFENHDDFAHKMARFSILCPNITSITLPLYRVPIEKEHDIISLLSQFSLTHLNITSLQPFSLSSWPQLQHVQLTWATGSLLVQYLEQLHVDCPKIETLHISAHHVDFAFLPTKTVVATTSLTELIVESQEYMEAIEYAFAYIACKYPQLKKLNVQSKSATSLKSNLEEEEEENDVGTLLLNRYSAYTAFAQKCQYIDTMQFKNIVPDPVLLDAMNTMRVRVQKFKIDTTFGISRSLFETMVRTMHESVVDLCINTSLRVRNTTVVLGTVLTSCKQLTKLELGKQPTVFIDSLLEYCPQLKQLVFHDTFLRRQKESTMIHTNLVELVLDKVTFMQDAMDQVGRQCPHLKQIQIVNSICFSDESSKQLQLNVSGRVKIERLYLNAKNTEVAFYGLTTKESSNARWYKVERRELTAMNEHSEYKSIVLICPPSTQVYLANNRINVE